VKVIHLPFCFYPDAVGGTEIYVEALAQELKILGVASVVAAPGEADAYWHEGLPVRRFPTGNGKRDVLREIYGAGDPQAAQAASRILDEEKPDVAHLHAFTSGVSLRVARAAKERGVPVVFTYHTPTVSCLRGTLLEQGRHVCDGVMEARRCAACVMEERGVPAAGRAALSYLPGGVGRAVGAAGRSGGAWTALRMTELAGLRHDATRDLFRETDAIVALCDWARELLLRNGVPAAKITLSRHGLSQPADAPGEPVAADARPLRVAFLGRADKVKGVDTLIRALRSIPDADLELHLYGVTNTADDVYWQQLKDLAAADPRIEFRPPAPHAQIVRLLRGYHLLAVPSRWLETGPLVVLEAFAAGVPVLGANLGGIAELVTDGVDGLLLPPDDAPAWGRALQRLSQDRELLARLRAGVAPPRTMAAVARDMRELYQSVAKTDELAGKNGYRGAS
jgi:glycosyltransferase involved in cell wall biosynthesis